MFLAIKSLTLQTKIQDRFSTYMLKTFIFFILSVAPLVSRAQTIDIDSLLSKMTRKEKTRLLVGNGWGSLFAGFDIPFSKGIVPGAAGETRGINRLGIRPLVLADGPAGLRLKRGMRTTAFPVGMSLACTHDTALVAAVGEAIADEARIYGIDVVLTPGMNLQTNPLCGRNYEYFSDDPVLTGHIAAAMVRGIQRRGVAACVKHFACNICETDRKHVNFTLDEQTLRRTYLKAFEIAINESNPWTLMSSYNLLNGTRTQEHPWLLTEVLRKEWNYSGVVLTDWTGVRHSALQIAAGNDLLMPGMKRQRWQIRRALRKGYLTEEQIDSCVHRILTLAGKTNRKELCHTSALLHEDILSEQPEYVDSIFRAHAVLARKAATAGMVYLKNEIGEVALDKACKRIALYGATSYEMLIGGTGSGHVNPLYVVNMNQALRYAGYEVNNEIEQMYLLYLNSRGSHKKSTFYLKKYLGTNGAKEKSIEKTLVDKQIENTDIAIITIGRQSGEGKDRTMTKGDYYLDDNESALIRKVSDAYHAAGKRVIVVLNVCGPIETASWKHMADAILVAWLPGQEAGSAVCDALTHPQPELTQLASPF